MAETPIGITFMPSADAAANGPAQAGIEGQGGSDLAQAFKILSLHLPRVLGAAAIAPKRLLTSPGAAGVPGQSAGGFNPYAAVFQSLLQHLTGGGMGGDASLASLFGDPGDGAAGASSNRLAPKIEPERGGELPRDIDAAPAPALEPSMPSTRQPNEPREPRNRYQ